MKERVKIEVKLYKRYFLTMHKHDYMWDGDANIIEDVENKEDYLYIKTLKDTEFVYVYTIKDDKVNYHGIVYWFIIDLLTVEELQQCDYKTMLDKIPEAFADNMSDAYANRKNVL